MIDYRKIWESINSESESNPLRSQIARRIPSKGVFPVFLATDFRKNIRLLYIKIDKDFDAVCESLPCFRGLEISISITSLGEFKNQKFIKFTQTIPNTDNIFELIISDICDKIVEIKEEKNLNLVLLRVMNEWKIFFEKFENTILSLSAQKGLIGELYFLRDYLFQKYNYTESLYYWTGSDRTNHDFQIHNNAIEIKTTSSKQHKKFIISSERQLDCTGLEHLYLSLFALNLHINMPDRTLPALIKSIFYMIQDDPIASLLFQIKLVKYGYSEGLAEKYNIGFSLADMKFFEVLEGFPRLLQRDLPNGIGDLKYSIMLAACSPFEINTDILKYI